MQRRDARTVSGKTTLEERWSSEFFNPKNIRLRQDTLTALKDLKRCYREG